MKVNLRLLFVALLASFAFTISGHAQTTTAETTPRPDSLSTLPDADMVFYVNASRIINDAMPRLVPEKELQTLRDGMDQMKAFTNIDLKHMEYVVIALRFNKPSGGKLFPIPDAMVTIRGDFDAKALVGMAMMMSQGMLREEKFGERSIYLLKLNDVAKGAANNPLGAAFSEIAITTLDGSTLAVGNTSYIKAALEAVDGRGRIKSETLASLMRDPSVLISATGSPLMSFAKTFGLRMAESTDPNCMTRFGEYFLALGMGDQDFKISGAMNADNPETAVMMKNMLSGFMQDGKSLLSDKNAQAMLDQVKLTAEASEVKIETTIPLEIARKYIREMFAPPPPPTAAAMETKTTLVAVENNTVKPKSKKKRRKK